MNRLAEHDRRSANAGHARVPGASSYRRGRGWIVALGLVAVAVGGCGGGASEAPQCSFFSNVCEPTLTALPAPPDAFIYPDRVTVQVGTAVAFTAQSTGIDNPAYRWQRSSDGGLNYTDIADANSANYTLARAQLVDDGAVFRVAVSGNGADVHAQARLAVSSLPGVVFQDGEFSPADWRVAQIAEPVLDGPTHSEQRGAAGGHPGAYRSLVHTMSAGPSALQVLHTRLSAIYDPAALGAIYTIDFTEDCIGANPSTSEFLVDTNLLLEQAGRSYSADGAIGCTSPIWAAMPSRTGLGARDFVQIAGPACAAGESCPDFSASGMVIRFGFVRGTKVSAGAAGGSIAHGIDNWKVTVWRR